MRAKGAKQDGTVLNWVASKKRGPTATETRFYFCLIPLKPHTLMSLHAFATIRVRPVQKESTVPRRVQTQLILVSIAQQENISTRLERVG